MAVHAGFGAALYCLACSLLGMYGAVHKTCLCAGAAGHAELPAALSLPALRTGPLAAGTCTTTLRTAHSSRAGHQAAACPKHSCCTCHSHSHNCLVHAAATPEQPCNRGHTCQSKWGYHTFGLLFPGGPSPCGPVHAGVCLLDLGRSSVVDVLPHS